MRVNKTISALVKVRSLEGAHDAMHGHLYFHSPCFDGTVSAALLADYLEAREDWDSLDLRPVNYDRKGKWLQTPLDEPAAIVDFLYHPDALFWADHHPTTFLTPAAQLDYERRKGDRQVFQPAARSCAVLLWTHLHRAFGHRNLHFEELVAWADKTDSANYQSVQEAIFGDAPALVIARALGAEDDPALCCRLVERLRSKSLLEVADFPDVRQRSDAVLAATKKGLKRVKKSARLDPSGIVLFNVKSQGVNINRYSPFLEYPDARYSLGIVESDDSAKITAMRNPWREFPSVPLGEIFKTEDGGGHQRVGSVLLDESRKGSVLDVFDRLLMRIKESDGISAGDEST
jgi:hypothetical protein